MLLLFSFIFSICCKFEAAGNEPVLWCLLHNSAKCSGAITDTLLPIPDKLVVLTFDDAVASHYDVVGPMLKEYGFGATFFVTEGFNFHTKPSEYLSWDQIVSLYKDGFEIGNHTKDHISINAQSLPQLREQIEVINERCKQYGIPKPVSFAYPGNFILKDALPILKEEGFLWARRGNIPEYKGGDDGRGFGYEPGVDDPLLIPSAGITLPAWGLKDFRESVQKAVNGKIAVIQFHGVPDREHPWVNTSPEQFRTYMDYLKKESYKVISMRDLIYYVDPEKEPIDPWLIIERRKKEQN